VIQADVDSGRVLNSAIVYAVDPQNTIITDISGSTTINDSPTITPIIQNPKIALLKSVSSNGQYLLGNRIKYSLEVINTGSVSLTNITLTDSKITDNIVLETTDQNGQLDVGESWSYSGTYTVTQADVDAGYVLNTATVIAKDSKGNTVSDISGSAINNNNPTQTAVIQSDKIALVKQVTSEGPYKIGSQIEYTFQVYNIGNTTLTQPIISDSKLNIAANYQSGDSNTNQKLEVSESWIFTGYYTVTSQDVQKGSISNSAIVTAYNTQGKQVKDSSGITVADNLPTITLINQAPVANPDSVITKMNIAIIIEILNNDLSGNGNLDTDSITIITQPEHGTLTINSDGTITYTPNDNYVGTDQFTYSVKDINGNVSNTTTVKIKILENQLVIPNVFTPNGDGKNETFHILGLDSYTGVELLIYSRWGAEVYNNLSYQNNWDGNGLNDGTYYYVLKLKRGDNATIYSGWILLKR
jgi:gliding motility-associated-like protein